MDFYQGLMVISVIHLLAAASPGPDFVLISQHTLAYGKRAGLWCSLGVALGLSVHIIYSTLGLATLVANSSSLLWIIKLLGGSYLIYLGIQGLKAKANKQAMSHPSDLLASIKVRKSLSMGFACNVLNPKAPVYFIALFTSVLSPAMPWHQLVIYGMWIMLLQGAWFSLLVYFLSLPAITKRMQLMGHWLERAFGVTMLVLGIKVLKS